MLTAAGADGAARTGRGAGRVGSQDGALQKLFDDVMIEQADHVAHRLAQTAEIWRTVFKIDRATKDVVWKLGGTERPRSLRVIGDPVFRAGGSISGQHDARMPRPGVLTLFDNGTFAHRAPRSVVYRINERARTATLVRRVKDPIARTSPCCGSTRVLPGGNHVTGWGGTAWISENKPDGTQVFRLNTTFVYRATPIADRRYTRRERRAAMNAQYRNGVFAHAAPAQVSNASHEDQEVLATQLGLLSEVEL